MSVDGSQSTHSERAVPSLPQVLHINPKNSLSFGAADLSASVSITLSNPTNKLVAFKVKTTAPKRYCVRPNGGIIKGSETVSVNIIYQPGDSKNDAQERARHKFLVQAIFIDNENVQLDQVWREVPKEKIMESKIRCQFQDNGGDDTAPEKEDRGKPDGAVLGAGPGVDLTESMRSTVAATNAAPHSESGSLDQRELELRRLGEDYRRAQDEIANLRDENRRLRENGERMRKSLQTIQGTPSSTSMSQLGSRPDAGVEWKADLMKPYIIGSMVVALIIGILIAQIF